MRRRGKGGAENFAQTQISSEYLLKVIGGFDPKPYDNIEKSSKMVVGKKGRKTCIQIPILSHCFLVPNPPF